MQVLVLNILFIVSKMYFMALVFDNHNNSSS